MLQCTGFSLRWLLLLWSMGSRRAGFSSCGTHAQQLWLVGFRAQAQQLWGMGLVAPRHVGSSWARALTCVPCIGRQILNHCAIREVPTWVHFYQLICRLYLGLTIFPAVFFFCSSIQLYHTILHLDLMVFFFFLNIYLFWLRCVLVAGSFSCGMWTPQLWHACGNQFPNQVLNLGPLHQEHGVLPTGPPGKSLDLMVSFDEQMFFILVQLSLSNELIDISFIICFISFLFQTPTLLVFSSKCFKSFPFMTLPSQNLLSNMVSSRDPISLLPHMDNRFFQQHTYIFIHSFIFLFPFLFLPPVLLRNDSHTSPYQFQVYSIVIQYFYRL